MDIGKSTHGYISLKGSVTTVFLSIDVPFLIDCLRFMKKSCYEFFTIMSIRCFRQTPTIKVESSWKYDTQEAHLAEID